jgi:hypothetical protein
MGGGQNKVDSPTSHFISGDKGVKPNHSNPPHCFGYWWDLQWVMITIYSLRVTYILNYLKTFSTACIISVSTTFCNVKEGSYIGNRVTRHPFFFLDMFSFETWNIYLGGLFQMWNCAPLILSQRKIIIQICYGWWAKRTTLPRVYMCGAEDSNMHGKCLLRLNVINYCHFTSKSMFSSVLQVLWLLIFKSPPVIPALVLL